MATTSRVYHIQLHAETTLLAFRYVRSVLREIQAGAKVAALGGTYSQGDLSRSIETDGPTVLGTTIIGSVGSNLPYAASVEGGAKIHPIFPKRLPGVYRYGSRRAPQLKFVWRGRLSYFPHIPGSPSKYGQSHPGQKGKGFLIRPAAEVATRRRLRIVVFQG